MGEDPEPDLRTVARLHAPDFTAQVQATGPGRHRRCHPTEGSEGLVTQEIAEFAGADPTGYGRAAGPRRVAGAKRGVVLINPPDGVGIARHQIPQAQPCFQAAGPNAEFAAACGVGFKKRERDRWLVVAAVGVSVRLMS